MELLDKAFIIVNQGFIVCAECINKIYYDTDTKGRKKYYCEKVDGIIREGLVLDTTNTSVCVKWGIYKGKNK